MLKWLRFSLEFEKYFKKKKNGRKICRLQISKIGLHYILYWSNTCLDPKFYITAHNCVDDAVWADIYIYEPRALIWVLCYEQLFYIYEPWALNLSAQCEQLFIFLSFALLSECSVMSSYVYLWALVSYPSALYEQLFLYVWALC